MTKTLIKVWLVYTGGDDRHDGPPTHFFREHSAATCFAKGNGWYGGDASVKEGYAIVVGDKTYLIDREIDLDQQQEKRRKELRQQAIAKLSPEELAALKDDD